MSLAQYHETVDPTSPAIVLLSPSGSPQPFYAEFGWYVPVGANVKVPGAGYDLAPGWEPARLVPGGRSRSVYDNGEGLVFRRTIAIDDKYLYHRSRTRW